MRLAVRTLALVSLAVFGLSFLFDVSLYQTDPYPRFFLFKLYLVLVGVLGLAPTLIGSSVASGLAARRRQWGWLAGLLAAVGTSAGFLYGAALDRPPPVVQVPITALSSAFDYVLGLNTSGSHSSPYIQAAAVACVLIVAPLVLLSHTFSAAATD